MKKVCSGTLLLNYFGGITKVEELKLNDILLTEDSKNTIITSVRKIGRTRCFRVIPEIGDPFVIAEDTMIALYSQESKRIIDFPVASLLKKDLVQRKKYSIVSTHVNYGRKDTANESYLVGMIAGRCHQLQTADFNETIKEYLMRRLDKLHDFVTERTKQATNSKKIVLEELTTILKEKKIPSTYIYNIRNERLNLLRGIIDSQITNVRKTVRSRSMERGRAMEIKQKPSSRSNSQERPKKQPV